MAQLEYIVQAFSIFVDGYGKFGSGEKCQVPIIKKKMEEFRGGGMMAPRKISLGYELFEIGFDLSEFDPQVIQQAGLFSKKDVPLTIRGHLDGDSGVKRTAIFQCRGEFEEITPDAWEPGKKAGLKTKSPVSKAKFTIDQTVIYDVDLKADVFIVGNEDIGAAIRASLGY